MLVTKKKQKRQGKKPYSGKLGIETTIKTQKGCCDSTGSKENPTEKSFDLTYASSR